MDGHNLYKAEKQPELFSDKSFTFTSKMKRKEKKLKAEKTTGCPERDKTEKLMAGTSESLSAAEPETDNNYDELDFLLTKKKKPKNKSRLVKFESVQPAPSLVTANFCEAHSNFTPNEENDDLYTYSEVSYFFVEINKLNCRLL